MKIEQVLPFCKIHSFLQLAHIISTLQSSTLGLRGPKQLFFHLTTTYWVKQSTQPSLAILLEVPRVYAKSLQLSLPYLILMSNLQIHATTTPNVK